MVQPGLCSWAWNLDLVKGLWSYLEFRVGYGGLGFQVLGFTF